MVLRETKNFAKEEVEGMHKRHSALIAGLGATVGLLAQSYVLGAVTKYLGGWSSFLIGVASLAGGFWVRNELLGDFLVGFGTYYLIIGVLQVLIGNKAGAFSGSTGA